MLEKITRNDQKAKIHCVLLSHELLSTKIYYKSIYISKMQKIFKIQEVHQKIHTKQLLLFYLNCFLLATHLNLMQLKKRD